MCKMYDQFVEILKYEMVPALGCTDPIGIAFCAATARKYAPGEIEHVDAYYSMNLIKNVAAVTIPETGGLCGPRIATALGVIGGDCEKKLETLKGILPEKVAESVAFEKTDKMRVSISGTDDKLYMSVTVKTDEHTATAVIKDEYTKIVSIVADGRELMDSGEDACVDFEKQLRYDLLSMKTILDFADNAPREKFEHIEKAIEMNVALAKAGLDEDYGAETGQIIRDVMAKGREKADPNYGAAMWASAGVDARMAGCPLPAMSNTGSGNQGIISTMPVYGAAQSMGASHEKLVKATAISCLTTIYIKHKLGALSTVCGGTVAGTGSGCGIVYLMGGGENEMINVLKNMFGNVAGMLCDGAKASCALKTATCVNAACLAADLALHGFGLESTNGIVGKAEDDTIDNFVRTSQDGLIKMDGVVLDIIMNK